MSMTPSGIEPDCRAVPQPTASPRTLSPAALFTGGEGGGKHDAQRRYGRSMGTETSLATLNIEYCDYTFLLSILCCMYMARKIDKCRGT